MTIEQLLQEGVAAHKKGELTAAERKYRTILQSHPNHPDANHNLGLIAVSVNSTEAALALFETAIEASPSVEQFWISYITALVKDNRLKKAKSAIKKAKKKGHDSKRLSNLLLQSKIPTAPSQEKLRKIVDLFGSGQYEEAEKLSTAILKDFPRHQLTWKILGRVLRAAGRASEALDANLKEVALGPKDADAHYNLGHTLKEFGRIEEAKVSLSKAISLQPDHAEAHRHLASLKRFENQDSQFKRMLELYLSGNISEEQRIHINFGLAKAHEDLGNFEQAFVHYCEGNELGRSILQYDIDEASKIFSRVKCTYPSIEQCAEALDKTSKTPTPIFIVGMPRSGTTLVEQIISSHTLVSAGGELSLAAEFGGDLACGVSKVTPEALLDFRSKYLAILAGRSRGKTMMTDKMPQNFLYLGLIAVALPEAKIIHVRRNPAAVCWANYKTHFSSIGLGFSCSLNDTVRYYGLYDKLMEFWAGALGKRIYQLDYEQLTVSQARETRLLLEYLELDWEESCLSPQDNVRAIQTASNIQARSKVYRGSSEQWKKYRPFLGDIFDDLSPPPSAH